MYCLYVNYKSGPGSTLDVWPPGGYAAAPMNSFVPWIPWLGGLFAFFCLLGSLHAAQRKRLVDDLPTSKTTGVFIGLVELKGTAEAELPLTSYLAQGTCVHYSWGIEERW